MALIPVSRINTGNIRSVYAFRKQMTKDWFGCSGGNPPFYLKHSGLNKPLIIKGIA